ncbi:MAG: LptF/LptG family permease, partial [Saprospiraceae bacterium]|nr:LptF/LptG family permease [Saprospiraceae bacterium]
MFKKLDKYIARKFLASFLFTMMIFTVIAMVIDYSDKVERFIEGAVPGDEIFFDYYLTFILFMLGHLIPLYTLISVVFFTSRLAFNSEMISILNAGVSFGRLLRPYLFAAGLIAAFHFVASHYLIPSGNKTRLEFEHTYIWKSNDKGKKTNVHFFIGPEEAVYVKRFSSRNQSADDF